jgi:hypothetical protein
MLVFCVYTSCNIGILHQRFGGTYCLCYPEDGGSRFLRNLDEYLQFYRREGKISLRCFLLLSGKGIGDGSSDLSA